MGSSCPPKELAQAKTAGNDARGCFLDNGSGSVTLQIESWDAKQISVTSPDFGKAGFFCRMRSSASSLIPGSRQPLPGNSAVETGVARLTGATSEGQVNPGEWQKRKSDQFPP